MAPDYTYFLQGNEMEQIKQRLQKEKQEFAAKKAYLKKEIAYTLSHKELLTAERDKLKDGLKKRNLLQKEISKGLYKAHLAAVKTIMESAEKVEESLKDLNILYETREAELTKLKEYIDQMKEEFLGVADRYEAILEKEEAK